MLWGNEIMKQGRFVIRWSWMWWTTLAAGALLSHVMKLAAGRTAGAAFISLVAFQTVCRCHLALKKNSLTLQNACGQGAQT